MPDSIVKSPSAKPSKPYEDFPLFAHQTGYWAKKVRGKLHYFGSWKDDPSGKDAVAEWLKVKDYLLNGLEPPTDLDGLTVAELCNQFLADREMRQEAGDLSPRTFRDYHDTCKKLVAKFNRNRQVDSLSPRDFKQLRAQFAKNYGTKRLGNLITWTKTIFNYGVEEGLLERPINFGASFKGATKKRQRQEKQSKNRKFFEADEIRQLVAAASQPMKAMILLGANCGFGNNDVGLLPRSAVDLKRGWIDYPRPKTSVNRRCPLWPETVAAVAEAMECRPKAKYSSDDGLAFLTKYGKPWAKETPDSPVAKEFRKLLDSEKLHRHGVGFYALRHVFETIAGECRDQKAVDAIMGHDSGETSNYYVERISDERLIDASNTVRSWLFGEVKPR